MSDLKDCIFCRIASDEIPSKKVYEKDGIIAFDDINPQAPVHTVIIPERHIATLNELTPFDNELVYRLVGAAKEIAKIKGIDRSGYRIVMNCNSDGGQMVFHIHLHLLGGRLMGWPPG